MRTVLHQDLVALARCLLSVAPEARKRVADLQINLAHQADRYRENSGKSHPVFGDGTLMSCCNGMSRKAERRIDDVEYADCLIQALESIMSFRMACLQNTSP